jgi:hypothetical protein
MVNSAMSPWEILLDAMDLKKAGRFRSAASQWKALDKKFRVKVLEYTLKIMKDSPPLGNGTLVKLRSKDFGTITLTDTIVHDLKKYIPEIVKDAGL